MAFEYKLPPNNHPTAQGGQAQTREVHLPPMWGGDGALGQALPPQECAQTGRGAQVRCLWLPNTRQEQPPEAHERPQCRKALCVPALRPDVPPQGESQHLPSEVHRAGPL